MKLNNKGQTLVLFILLLPLLLMLFVFIVDIGNLYIEKRKLEKTISNTIDYGIKNIDNENLEQELNKYINLNLKNIDKINITITDKDIKIEVKRTINSIFSFIGPKTYTFNEIKVKIIERG